MQEYMEDSIPVFCKEKNFLYLYAYPMQQRIQDKVYCKRRYQINICSHLEHYFFGGGRGYTTRPECPVPMFQIKFKKNHQKGQHRGSKHV